MLATYHNHTSWSDGKATPGEMLAAARAMGIAELGISDHWVQHPAGMQFKWAMPTAKLPDYVNTLVELRDHAHRHGGTQVRIGLEVDWFPGRAAQLGNALAPFPFDYIIGSVHQIEVPGVGEFMIDGSPAAWERISPAQRDQVHRHYWINMKTLAESGVFDIVAHIDLPKKFGFYATIDLSREIGDVLDAIDAARTSSGQKLVVELNTAGWHKPCGCGYPSLEILRECKRRDIPVTINADAHQPDHLLRDFDRAAERLANAGYTHIARFAQRQTRFDPIGDAVGSRA
jgi:histidinol-phosphatase (PHP family)